MKILLLNADRSSTLAMDELLVVWPDRYDLLRAVVCRGALPSLAGEVAQRDPEAGRKFIKRLDKVVAMEQVEVKRMKTEVYRSLVLSALARARSHDILGEME